MEPSPHFSSINLDPMKTNIILIFILLLGLTLILGGVAIWHLSSTTEFTRADQQSAPATPIQ